VSEVALEHAYAETRRIARASGSSFYTGMRLLPAGRREALFAVYALARRIDDIADEDGAPDDKLAQLRALRAELAALERSADPVLVAVRDAASRFPIPLSAFDDLLDGAEADVRGTDYATFADLERYCRCVAGSIGRLSLGVFETSDRAAAEPLADDLGVALQLANILRDVRDDLDHGRRYLPQEDLDRFGCRFDGATIEGDAERVLAYGAERALAWLDRGLALVPLLDRRSARCVQAMTAAYGRLLERIADDPGAALVARVSLPRWEKPLVVAGSLVRRAA
jgi:15-cis-phytoene synthase